MVWWGMVAVLVAVLLYALATVFQAEGARACVRSSRSAPTLGDLMHSRLWWAGVAFLAPAFLAFAASTQVLPLPVAATVRSSYIVVAILFAHLAVRTRPQAFEVAGAMMAVGGIAVFVASGAERGDGPAGTGLTVVMAVVLVAILLGAGLLGALAEGHPRFAGGAYAALAGAAFALLDLGLRSLPSPVSIPVALGTTACWLGAVAAPLGLWLFARAAALTTVAVAGTLLVLVDVVAASGLSAWAFGDVPDGGAAPWAVAGTMMVLGVAMVMVAAPDRVAMVLGPNAAGDSQAPSRG